jgi:hypothetical protein
MLPLLPLPISPAVLVWSRALGLLTPLSSKLGAMLYIVRRAAEEVGVLVPVILVLMLVSMHFWTKNCRLHLLPMLRST